MLESLHRPGTGADSAGLFSVNGKNHWSVVRPSYSSDFESQRALAIFSALRGWKASTAQCSETGRRRAAEISRLVRCSSRLHNPYLSLRELHYDGYGL